MKSENERRFERLPATLAVGAPILTVVTFLLLLFAFYASVMAHRVLLHQEAHRELASRAELAAKTLEEPLRTLDFATIRAFGESCSARGYELSVRSGAGGIVFDTRRESRTDSTELWVASGAKSGEYNVLLMRPRAEVFAPFSRMYRLFVLAALVGASGMFAVFFVLYRQRVRIRELAKLERFRREFIADVSHEIKTPLTGILCAADMMDGASPLAGMIRKEARRLNGLVQSTLDLARLEREGNVLNLTETDLVELVSETVESLRPQALAAGIELSFATPQRPHGGETVSVDGQLIACAVSNLIANAIRHSGSKDVAVSLDFAGKAVRVNVEDHGVGVPPEHAAQIFERFHRVDPARSAETGGAGLGLAIVRRIARLHGGDVTLASVRPRGSRFTLELKRGLR